MAPIRARNHVDKRGGALPRGRLALRIDACLARPPHASEYRIRAVAQPEGSQKLADCVELARRIAATKPFSDYFDEEISPGPKVGSREEIKSFLHEHVQTYLHMTSSAPMGVEDDPHAVVDANGKVRGVDDLYVGDASIMPDTPSVAINPTVIMIAEIVWIRIEAVRAKTIGHNSVRSQVISAT